MLDLRRKRAVVAGVAGLLAFSACKINVDRTLLPGELRGRLLVVSAQGTVPASDAQVNILGSQLGAKADANGRFVFQGLTAGTYTLNILRDLSGNGKLSTALLLQNIVIDTFAGKPDARDLGDVVVTATGNLKGLVTRSGAPLTGAQVIVRNLTQQTVAPTGDYLFAELPAGSYELFMLDPDNMLYGGSSGAGVRVTIPPGGTVQQNLEENSLVQATSGTVSGVAEEVGAGAVAGATVSLMGGPTFGTNTVGTWAGSTPAGVYTVIGHKDGDSDGVIQDFVVDGDTSAPPLVLVPLGTAGVSLNPCANNGSGADGPCSANATCTAQGSAATCACNAGFTGNGYSCLANDACAANGQLCDSHATCSSAAGSFTCTCNTGYVGDGFTCASSDACQTNNGGCDPNAACSVATGSLTCTCNAGYQQDSANPNQCDSVCTLHTDTCDPHATCTNSTLAPEGYTCTCNTGFTGTGTTCTAIDYCASSTTNNCDPNATCTNTEGGFVCTCNAGYEGSGESCAVVDYCGLGLGNCDPNATCANVNGAPRCTCNANYTGNGQTCTRIDVCAAGLITCDVNATCTDNSSVPAGATCTCNPGYEPATMNPDPNNPKCVDSDECTNGVAAMQCSPYSTCTNVAGSYICTCNTDFTGDGHTCTWQDPCPTADCNENASCSSVPNTSGYTCACNAGYVGDGYTTCNTNDCAANPCDPHATCEDTSTSHTCTCNAGWTGSGGQCVRTFGSVAAGSDFTCALKTDNSLWCWGDNTSGQLGIGATPTHAPSPREVSGSYQQLTAGTAHTCAVSSVDQSLWCWGDDSAGQTGTGTGQVRVRPESGGLDVTVPTQVSPLPWVQVSAGAIHTCAIQQGPPQTLWCWGDNSEGELGDGANTSEGAPEPITIAGGGPPGWKEVSCGNLFTCAVGTDGSLWCWGDDSSGQLGDGAVVEELAPEAIQVTGALADGWVSVSAGFSHACGIQTDGSLWCWGDDTDGEVGNGTTEPTASPVNVEPGTKWSSVSAGDLFTCGTQQGSGQLYCWGNNAAGQAGGGESLTQPVTSPSPITTPSGEHPDWALVATNGNHACAVNADGTLWCWGQDSAGELGDSNNMIESSPVNVPDFAADPCFPVGETGPVCDANATCTSSVASPDATCTCNAGYAGPGTPGTCAEIDPCTNGSLTCDPNATCTNPSPGVGVCTCNPGFVGSGQTCTAAPLTIVPATVTVAPLGSQVFTTTGGVGTITWSLTTNGSGGSIIPGTGAYTAGATGNTTDIVTATDTLGDTATATITVGPAVTIAPALATVAVGGTVTFEASGGSGTGFSFTLLVSSSGGSITSAGAYIAGPTPDVSDTVQVSDSLGNTASAVVNVVAPLGVVPVTVSLPPLGTETFTTTGGSGTVTWALTTNSSGGSINATTGAYIAGAAGNTSDIVTATDGIGDTATATISVGSGVSVAPASPVVAVGGTIDFVAVGGSGSGYSFSLLVNNSGGSITTAGVYTAGALPGVADQVEVSDSLGNAATVTVDIVALLAVAPATVSLAPLAPQTFTSTGGFGTVTWALTTNGSGGSINPATGAYTAGTSGNTTDVVTATDGIGDQATATVSVGAGLSIAPSTVAIEVGGNVTFAASGGSGSGYGFTLLVNNSGATITGAGLYTAGATPGADQIQVTDSLGNTATVVVNVVAPLAVVPPTVSLSVLTTQTFTTTGGFGTVTWTLTTNNSGGSVNAATGVYIAGATPSVTDVVTATDGIGDTASATIVIGSGLGIGPSAPSIAVGGTLQFTAAGGSGSGYTFTLLVNNSGATVTAAGLYTAGSTSGVSDTVQVSDSAGNTATAVVNVVAPLVVLPATVSIAALGSQTFTTTGGYGVVTWALTTNGSGGSINASTGVYTAGPSGNTTDVITATDGIGDTASATVSVRLGVSLTPSVTTVETGGTVTFSASGGSGTGYAFTLLINNSGGSLTGAGVYTAGATSGVSDTIQVTDSLGDTAQAVVNVVGLLAVVPATVTVAPLGSQTFTTTGGSGSITWTLTTNGSGGSLNANSGAYVAGANANTTDVVTATDGNGDTATATITIGPGVSIAPLVTTVAVGDTVTYSASGGSGSGFVFTLLANNSGGSITSAGVYTAGSLSGVSDTVGVTDSLGNTATAVVSVVVGLQILPATASVTPLGGEAFTTSGGVGEVTWTLQTNGSGGSVTAAGAYTAGVVGSTTDVVEATDSLGNVATAIVTVGPGVSVAPATVTVPAGTSQTFTASGGTGTGFTWSISSNLSGGAITASGLYTAGVTSGVTDTIQAVDSLGNIGTALATVGPSNLLSITVTPAGQSVNLFNTLQMTATGSYTDGSTPNITSVVSWTTSDPTIATISSTGLLQTVGEGSVNAIASLGPIQGSSSVNVTAIFSVGGTVAGSTGPVVLQDNLTDTATVPTAGPFSFALPLQEGSAYSVTVETSPADQVCTVTNGTGTMGTAPITNVSVQCSTFYGIGGTLSGLTAGSVTLLNEDGDPLVLSANGPFTFDTTVSPNTPYAVTVGTQPANQFCSVTSGTGNAVADVSAIAVTCVPTYAIGGTIAGLNGSLVLNNSGLENVTFTSSGPFAFDLQLLGSASYDVTITTQPPGQTCSITSGSGPVNNAPVTGITVSCVNIYTIGGTLSGLQGTLVLQDNGVDNLTLTQDGAFTFATPVIQGNPYAVTVFQQPAGQQCTVSNDTGGTAVANVTDVVVTCVSVYTISGTVAGLQGTVVIADNITDTLSISAAGPFTFDVPVLAGSPYSVTVVSSPSGQQCSVTFDQGGTAEAAVTDIMVDCETNVGVVCTTDSTCGFDQMCFNGGCAEIALAPSGGNCDPTDCSDNACTGAISGNACAVAGCSASLASPDPSGVVACNPDYVINVTESGLTAGSLVLAQGEDTLSITVDGTYTFPAAQPYGADYDVFAISEPPNQLCTVDGKSPSPASGTVLSDVTVAWDCVPTYAVGGTFTLYGPGPATLADNVGDTLTPTSSGTFTFQTQYVAGAAYNVTVTPPTGAVCSVVNGSGTVPGAPVSNIVVTCLPSYRSVSAGYEATCTIKSDGTLWCWGGNQFGELGDNTLAAKSNPEQVTTDTDWASVSEGTQVGCAVKTGGTLWCWGGAQSDGGSAVPSVPHQVNSDTDWASVSVGAVDQCAIKTGGTLWCWGPNASGQDGYSGSQSTPTQVGTDTDWVQVSQGGDHACAVKTNDTAWCWGSNSLGQLGSGGGPDGYPTVGPAQVVDCIDGLNLPDGGTAAPGCATEVSPSSDWVAVAAGAEHSCGLRTDGSVWCWGDDSVGALGDVGALGSSDFPVKIAGELPAFTSVTSGSGFACGDGSDQSVWCWGNGSQGQLGDGQGTEEGPTQVLPGDVYVLSSAGAAHACAATNSSTLACWGGNASGQLGEGNTTAETSPIGTPNDALDDCLSSADNNCDPNATCTPSQYSYSCACNTGYSGDGFSCTINTYTITLTISGSTQPATIADGIGTDSVTTSGDGQYTFPAENYGSTYAITITAQPAGELCLVTADPSGTLTANISDVAVTCQPAQTLGGVLNGASGPVTLTNSNTGDTLTVPSNGAFTFDTPVVEGSDYAVAVAVPPSGQICQLFNASGTEGTAPVTNVVVDCGTGVTIGGTISGLDEGATITLLDNGGDTLSETGPGQAFAFTFPTEVPIGGTYAVSVQAPAGIACNVTNDPSGTPAANVSDIAITCYDYYTITGTISGLTGTLSLQDTINRDQTLDPLSLSANGSFAFAAGVPAGASWNVSVTAYPAGQTCGLTGSLFGSDIAANVSNIVITCWPGATVGGTILGLGGQPVTFQDNGGDNLTLGSDGTFTFPTPVATGSPYSVTLSSTTGPTCTITNGSGTMASSPVTNVSISCLPGYVAVSTGYQTTCAIRSDGTLWCWGDNGNDTTGTGDGNQVDGFPTQVGTQTNWTAVSVGTQTACGLQSDGSMWCWGTPQTGNFPLSTPDSFDAGSQLAVNGVTTIDYVYTTTGQSIDFAVSGGAPSYGVTFQQNGSGGSLVLTSTNHPTYTAGSNPNTFDYLQFNDSLGATVPVIVVVYAPTPARVGSESDWASVSTGLDDNPCALKTDHSLWCWGPNNDGESGNGTTTGVPLPVQVGTDETWAQISAGGNYLDDTFPQEGHSCGVKVDGSAWCWGDNSYGELGIGPPASGTQTTPVQVLDCPAGDDASGTCSAPLVAQTNWQTVVAGTDHTCGLRTDGSLWCWGENQQGQLGNGNNTNYTYPVQVGSSTYQSVTVGDQASCGLQGGIGWCWGNDGDGKLGNGTTGGTESSPVQIVQNPNPWKLLSEGDDQGCGIQIDNSLWCWGNDAASQLGDGQTGESGGPDEPVALQVIDAPPAGGSQIVVEVTGETGTVVVADNAGDQLTFGAGQASDEQIFPTLIPAGGSYNVTIVSSPGMSCTISNGSGSGIPAVVAISVDISCLPLYTVSGTVTGLTAALGGNSQLATFLVLEDNGGVGGDNLAFTQDGSFTFAAPIVSGSPYDVTIGQYPQGAYCSIQNAASINGGITGNVTNVTVTCVAGFAVGGTISGSTGSSGTSTTTLTDSNGDSVTLSQDGTFTFPTPVPTGSSYAVTAAPPSGYVCEVQNGNGTMGSAAVTSVSVICNTSQTVSGRVHGSTGPVTLQDQNGDQATGSGEVGAFSFADGVPTGGTYNVTVASAPAGDTCLVTNGSGTASASGVPSITVDCVEYEPEVGVGQYDACDIKSDHSVWCWGWDPYGELGDGSTQTQGYPSQIHDGGGRLYSRLSVGGTTTCAIDNAGSLWCWGNNGSGQVGNTSAGSPQTTPLQVAANGANTWTSVSAGDAHVCGTQSDGSLWCWGSDGTGQIGNGSSGSLVTTPTQVSTNYFGENLYGWQMVSAGGSHTCGIQTTEYGTMLWCWGSDQYGQLGDGNTGTNATSPEQIYDPDSGATWSSVSAGLTHTCAIDSVGELWCWGHNGDGELGVGNTTATFATPQQVGSLSTWTLVSAGEEMTCGLQSGGSLWCWGADSSGQLGDGATATQTAPEQIDASQSWLTVVTKYFNTCGLSSDRQLWCWGDNSYGQLGTGPVPQNTSMSFSNCGASGDDGPSQAQCDSAYGTPGLVQIAGHGIQNWTVPATGTYTITATGAQGGSAGGTGGLGAYVNGNFYLTAGTVLQIAVGQQGGANVPEQIAGGGGGTFVVQAGASEPLVVAGGGGGSISGTGNPGLAGNSGGQGDGAAGGSNGQGGADSEAWGSGGGGFLGDGQADPGDSTGGFSFTDGAVGGVGVSEYNASGGFGGGGGAGYPGQEATGGGGGYSGGGGGNNNAGGGGSYNADPNGTSTSGGGAAGNGTLTIQLVEMSTVEVAVPNIYADPCENGTATCSPAIACANNPTGYTCTSYPLTGNVTGLEANPNPPLEIENTDDGEIVTITSNGPFAFVNAISWGGSYDITFPQQPPGEVCSILVADPTVTGPISPLQITCVPLVSIGGTVSGTQGATVILQNTNESLQTVDTLSVPGDGTFTFDVALTEGTPYAVTISQAPQGLICEVTNGTGTAPATNVTNISVVCGAAETVGGTVTGLYSSGETPGTVTLALNGGIPATLSSTGSFTLPDDVPSGGTYTVTVAQQPSDGQVCSVGNATGTAGTSNISDLAVYCGAPNSGIALGDFSTCAVRNDLTATGNNVWCWGSDQAGQIGDGTTYERDFPTEINTDGGYTFGSSLTAGSLHACALDTADELWCWGDNTYGEIGAGSTTTPARPTLVDDPAEDGSSNWHQVSAGGSHTCAVDNSQSGEGGFNGGLLWCWGDNTWGELGTTKIGNGPNPTSVVGQWQESESDAGVDQVIYYPGGAASSNVGEGSLNGSWTLSGSTLTVTWGNEEVDTLTLSSDGTTLTGSNSSGTAITETNLSTLATSPVQVSSESLWTSASAGVEHTCAIDNSSNLWCWGDDGSGELGDGQSGFQLTPEQISNPNGTTWSSVSAGNLFTCAVDNNQTLWCWGDNTYGQLGINGQPETYNTPQQVGNAGYWQSVAAGTHTTCAIDIASDLWCWGANESGELGDGTTNPQPAPEQIGAGSWTAVATKNTHSCALATDQTVWCWGDDSVGELGDGTQNQELAPLQVPESNQDDCRLNEFSCPTNSYCSNVPDSYTCLCDPGYTDDGDGGCDLVQYALGGTVTGLAGEVTLVLGNSGDQDSVTITQNGTFQFPTELSVVNALAYNVSVTEQPGGQQCTVSNGSGIASGDVTSITVSCASYYTVGGGVVGLNANNSVTIVDNGSDTLTTSANGSFTFAVPIQAGGSYSVTLASEPPGQVCVVTGGTGTDVSTDVTSVFIECGAPQSVAVTPVNPTLQWGQTLQLDAAATWPDGTTADVTTLASWTSDSAVTPVNSATGLVDTTQSTTIGTGDVSAALNGTSSSTTITVTAIPFAISNLVTENQAGTAASLFSAVSSYNVLQVQFDSTEPLDSSPAALSVTVGQYALSCGTYQTSGPNYTCTYTFTGTEVDQSGTSIAAEPNAVLNVVVTGVDWVSANSSASTPVTVDFTAPSLTAPPVLTYVPGSGNPISSPTAATVGTDMDVTFNVSETLGANPTLALASTSLSFGFTSSNGTAYVYDGYVTSRGNPPDGQYTLTITATDLVGNTATLTPGSPVVTVLTTPPGTPAVSTAGTIVYTRIPWGDNATGGTPTFSVQGQAGAVQDNSTVLIYSWSDASPQELIATGTADGTGAFNLVLDNTDRSVVFLVAADNAGNTCAPTAVQNVVWTASFDHKVSGDLTANPHVLQLDSNFNPPSTEEYEGLLELDPQYTTEAPSYASLASIDGNTVEATATNTVFHLPPLNGNNPSGLSNVGFAFDSERGRLVLFGGENQNEGVTSSTWEWDSSSFTWDEVYAGTTSTGSGGYRLGTGETPTPISPRSDYGVAYDAQRGRTFVFGGYDANDNTLSDFWEWDGTSWTQPATASTTNPAGRADPGMAYDPVRGVVVLFGGYSEASGNLNDTWEWNGTAWKDLTPVSVDGGTAISPSVRVSCAMSYDPVNSQMLLTGGYLSDSAANDTWEWDGSVWSQLSPTTAAPGRAAAGIATDTSRNRVVLFGGQDFNGGFYNDIWEWDGATWTNVATQSQAPTARAFAAMAYDPRFQQTVLYGGASSDGPPFSDMWSWSGTTWVNLTPTGTTPPNRSDLRITFDGARGNLVLFGGYGEGGQYYSDTWTFADDLWTQAQTQGGPSGRVEHSMAYDSARQVTVMFGGYNANGPALDDLWEWNGTQWLATMAGEDGSVPSPRFSAAMSYDSGNAVTVLFGGQDGNANILGDTWTWSGSQFVNVTPDGSSPPGRIDAAMTYDSARGRTVLFGGSDDQGHVLSDTWEWDGAAWYDVTPTQGGPQGRDFTSMTYDSVRGRSILIGGLDQFSNLIADVWEWDGTTWTNVTPSGMPDVADVALAYDVAHARTWAFVGIPSGHATGDLLVESPTDANRQAAEVAQFSFAAAGEPLATVTGVSFQATVGGDGSTLVLPGDGTDVSGATMEAWSTSSNAWVSLATETGNATSPQPVSFTDSSPSDAQQYLVGGPQTINLAFVSSDGRGNGPTSPVVAVDYVEVTVDYTRPNDTPCRSDNDCAAGSGTYCSALNACVPGCDTDAQCPVEGDTCNASTHQCASVCEEGQTLCQGTCVDTSTDTQNCGTCGFVCGEGYNCNGGRCSPT